MCSLSGPQCLKWERACPEHAESTYSIFKIIQYRIYSEVILSKANQGVTLVFQVLGTGFGERRWHLHCLSHWEAILLGFETRRGAFFISAQQGVNWNPSSEASEHRLCCKCQVNVHRGAVSDSCSADRRMHQGHVADLPLSVGPLTDSESCYP